MKFSEKWRLAGIIATEVRFKGYLETNPTNLSRVKENPERIANQIRSSSRFTILISAVLILTLTALTIGMVGFDVTIGAGNIRMAIGFGLYLLFSFVILFFLNLTTSTGFFGSGAMKLPATLPLSRPELEYLSILSFARVFIAPAALLVSVYPIFSLFLFGPLAALSSFIGCAATVAISMGALLGFSKWFHKKTHSADESRMSTIVRLAATFGLVLGFLSVYMISNLMYDIVIVFVSIATEVGPTLYWILTLVFPFSFGFLSSFATYGVGFGIETLALGLIAVLFYSIVAVRAFRNAGAILREVSVGGATAGRIGLMREIVMEIASPLKALVKKDLKLASKNVGSAFVFVVPIFLAFVMYPMISFWGDGVRSMTGLVATEYANFFAGISIVSILMFDSQGASIQEGLPQSTRMTLNAKTVIAFPIYVFSLVMMAVLIALQPLFTPLLIFIPLAQIPAGYALSLLVGGAIYWKRGGGRAVAISFTSDSSMVMIAGAIAGIIGIIPLLAYGITMLLTGWHALCLATQFLSALALAGIAHRTVNRILKD
ncbi:MAG: hypothetical protein ACFFEF_03485 [Candidatus Thorarchaeota archaeon]